MIQSRFALVVFGVVASSCKPAAPPHIVLGACTTGLTASKLACASLPGSDHPVLAVDLKGTDLVVMVHNAHDGTKVTLGSASQQSGAGELTVSTSVRDQLDKITISQLLGTDPVDLGVSFQLELPGYAKTTVQVPPLHLGEVLGNGHALKDGKLGLGPNAPAAHTVFLGARVKQPIIGPAKTLADIDWVALLEQKPLVEEGGCDYMDEHQAPEHFKKEVEVMTATLYDRRTGAALETRDFHALGGCPQTISSNEGSVRVYFINEASFDQITQWLGQRIQSP